MLKKIIFLFTLYFVWFCFAEPVFFNPVSPSLNPVFSPIPLFLTPQQTSFIFPEQTPLNPLCPQSMPVDLCFSLTSMPFMQMDDQQSSFPTMFTPFFVPSEDVSSNRLEKLLDEESWVTYDYSREDYSFKRSSKKKKEKKPVKKTEKEPEKEPDVTKEEKKSDVMEEKESKVDEKSSPIKKEDSFSIHYNQKDPNQVIMEETRNGRKTIQKGKVKAIPTEEVQTRKNKQGKTEIIVEDPTQSVDLILRESEEKIDCTNLNNSSTEAGAVCVQCSEESIQESKKTIVNKLKHTICYTRFVKIIRDNFNRTCYPLKFNEYVKNFLICESCKENIPPALMLSMMTVESSGKCDAGRTDSRENSAGLFQINARTERDSRQCTAEEKKNITASNLEKLKMGPQCLHNPIMNTRKSMEILKKKYQRTNSKNADFQCSKNNIASQNNDSWRKAVSAYNGGERRIQRKLRLIQTKPGNIDQAVWDRMSEWQKIRTYYFYCSSQNRCNTANFKHSISNLAHTEAVFGSVDPPRQPTISQKWQDVFPDLNNNSHCK